MDLRELRYFCAIVEQGSFNKARRLKRVFRIDIAKCERCGEQVKIIGQVEPAHPRR